MANGSDDFIRSTGNLAFVNLFLKYAVIVLGLAVLGLTICLIHLSGKVGQVKPLPIYVNTITGETKPVDFSVIDAQGRERLPAEIENFTRTYMDNLYTYNNLTVKSNMDRAFCRTAPDGLAQVKECLGLAQRADIISRGGQGLCEILGVSIMGTTPNITVQAVFKKKLFGFNDEMVSESTYVAIIKMKPIARQVQNAHGLAVVEYSENLFKEDVSQ